jgi:hypothetical protein
MPLKKGEVATSDYWTGKKIVEELKVGESRLVLFEKKKVLQKYIYEIGLKAKPERREFSTKKVSQDELRVTRIV